MQKYYVFLLLSLLTISSVNAQRFLEAQIIYPNLGQPGSVHYVFHGETQQLTYKTNISYIDGTDTNIIGEDILNIDTVFRVYKGYAVNNNNDTVGSIGFMTGNSTMNMNYYNFVLDSINSTTTGYLCNGICNTTINSYIANSNSPDPDYYMLYFNIDHVNNTHDTAFIEDLNLTDLCEGEYIIEAIKYGTGLFFTTFYIDANINSAPIFSINAVTYSTSTQNVCNGSVKAIVNGGVSPYTYSWDNGTYTTEDSLSNLCTGIHTLIVVDSNNDTSAVNFGITDSAHTYNNQNDTTIFPIDTITYLIENCNINYNLPLDSAFVINFDVIDTNTLILECVLWQAGTSIQTYDTINYYSEGYNYLEISFYCNTNKSNSVILKFTDYINIEYLTNIPEIDINNIVLYPNPTSGVFTIIGDNISNIDILDINGRLIKSFKVNSSNFKIDISNNQKGIYFIKILSSDKTIVKKLSYN